MKLLRHAAAIVLVGYFFMLPPKWGALNDPWHHPFTTDYRGWIYMGHFDSEAACIAGRRAYALAVLPPKPTSATAVLNWQIGESQCVTADQLR
jgi:hypothetical protein